jgi:hypothetical protein
VLVFELRPTTAFGYGRGEVFTAVGIADERTCRTPRDLLPISR